MKILNVKIFVVVIFTHSRHIRNIRKFAPYENFLLYCRNWMQQGASEASPPVLHAGLFTQTLEADVLINPNCGMTPSRKPLAIMALNLELPRGSQVAKKFKLTS